MCQFSGKTKNFYFFDLNLSKNEFCGRNFENLTRDAESAPPRYYMCLFSGTTDQFDFFGANFGSYNVESVADSWVEAEMNWVELDGAGWRLK